MNQTRRQKPLAYIKKNRLSIIEFCDMAKIKVLDFLEFMEGNENFATFNSVAESVAKMLGVTVEEVLEYDGEPEPVTEYDIGDRTFASIGIARFCNGENCTPFKWDK